MAGGKVVSRLLWSLVLAGALVAGSLYGAARLLPGEDARAAEARAVYAQLQAPGVDTAVYRLAEGARVKDLFGAARVPLPRSLDGGRDLVSGRAFVVEPGGGASEAWMPGERLVALGVPVPLNECGLQDLVAIPGIGQATALKILQARAERGPFDDLQDVAERAGLGQASLEALRDHAGFRSGSGGL